MEQEFQNVYEMVKAGQTTLTVDGKVRTIETVWRLDSFTYNVFLTFTSAFDKSSVVLNAWDSEWRELVSAC